MGYEWIIVRRHLCSMGRQMGFTSAIAIVGVGLGVAVLVITLSVMNGYADMIFDRQVDMNPHVTVRRPYSERIENYATIVHLLEEHPEVVKANPVIETEGYVLRRVKSVGAVTSGVLVRGGGQCGHGERHRPSYNRGHTGIDAPGRRCFRDGDRQNTRRKIGRLGGVKNSLVGRAQRGEHGPYAPASAICGHGYF